MDFAKFNHLTLYSLPPLAGSVVFLFLGFFVLFHRPQTKAKILFSVLCFETFFWEFAWFTSFYTPSEHLTFIAKLVYLVITFLPFTYYHFILSYFDQKKESKLTIIFYSIAAAFVTLIYPTDLYIAGNRQFAWGNFTLPGPFFIIFVAFALVSILLALKVIHTQLIAAKYQPEKHNKIKYIYLAFFIYFFCSLDFLQVYGVSFYPVGTFFFLLSFLIMSYAIVKHRLLDIKILLEKTIYYTFWTALISGFYAMFVLLIQLLISGADIISIIQSKRFTNILYRNSGVLSALTNTGLAAFVYLRNNKSIIAIRFAILSLAIGLWAVGSWLVNIIPNEIYALNVLRFNYAFGVFVPALFIHFVCSVTGKKRDRAVKIAYFISSVLLLFIPTPLFIKGLNVVGDYHFLITHPGYFYYLFLAHFCFYFFLSLNDIWKSRQISNSITTKKRLEYIFLAYLIGSLAGVEYFCCVLGFIKRPPLDDYILILTFALIAYSIAKHELFDIRLAAKRTLFYSVLALLISLFYILIIFLIHQCILGIPMTPTHLINSVFLILLITLILRPIEAVTKNILDRRFFKGTIQQIAQQKEFLETELERANRLKSVGVLAAGMAHEIKNPMTAIKTFADYLPKKYEDKEFREKFSTLVNQEILRMQEIVNNLLLFSKPKEPLKKEVNVENILSDIANLLSAEAMKSRVEIKLNFTATNPRAFVDAEQIKQALLNIAMNGIDAMKNKNTGVLVFETESSPGFLKITIKDNGCGIATDKIAHIYDPFYTDKDQGTGLGLAITYSIIQKNSGRIEIESRVGDGTDFILYLPIHAKA